MRNLIFLVILPLAICSCRSQKETHIDSASFTDSLVRSESHRSIEVIDSLFRSSSLRFDTLRIHIQRQSPVADVPEEINITAVNGSIVDDSRLHRDIIAVHNRLDTTAFKQASSENSCEHTTTTRAYSPPDGTAIVIIGCLIIVIFVYIHMKKS